ncbi:MAG TPA: helix-turn-helix domain-containing protein, partial [Patescibacteria group bacterium]|nr:helix-turn-helix domain-containing protein [Patescibacteria group bacterium]
MEDNLLSIQEAAKKLKASTKTLRRWEERGILVPQRTAGSHRRYTKEQIEKFQSDLKAKKISTHALSQVSDEVIAPPGFVDPSPVGGEGLREGGLYQDQSVEVLESAAKIEEEPREVIEEVNSEPTVLKQFESERSSIKLPKVALSRSQRIVFVGSMASFACLLLFVLSVKALPIGEEFLGKKNDQFSVAKAKADDHVLAASTTDQKYVLNVNVISSFQKEANFIGGLKIDNRAVLTPADKEGSYIDLGTGTILASNIIYGVTAGTGIDVTSGQNPVITNTGVLSIGGQTGNVTLTAGSGISISGNTITNTVPAATTPNTFSNIVSGSDTITAGSSNDTLTFDAGSGISITADTSNKSLTISALGGISSPFEQTGGVVSFVDPSSVTELQIAPSNGSGLVSFNLATLTVNGQTGVSESSPSCVTTTNGVVTGTGVCQLGSEQWVASNGTLYPGVSSYDLLIGGTSTASAKFAVLNMAAGTPVASLSGTTNGVALAGNGSIQSIRNGTLTIGGATTGNISLLPLNGTGMVGIGTSTPTSTLDVSGGIRLGTAGVNNVLNTSAAGGSPTGDLYWGSRILCDNTGNCAGSGAGIGGSGTANRLAKFTSVFNVGNSSINDLYGGGVALTFDVLGHVGIGTGTPAGLFGVEGAPPNGALAVFNYTGSGQNIITASASGVSVFNVDQSGNVKLANGGGYFINNSQVLSATTLGTSVVNSSLTSVGTISSGTWNGTAIAAQYGGTG